MTETIELQACEHCSKSAILETMTRMEDGWFCDDCTAEWHKFFDSCAHDWSPHIDQMGDEGQVCQKCCGFVRDEDFPDMFGRQAPPRS